MLHWHVHWNLHCMFSLPSFVVSYFLHMCLLHLTVYSFSSSFEVIVYVHCLNVFMLLCMRFFNVSVLYLRVLLFCCRYCFWSNVPLHVFVYIDCTIFVWVSYGSALIQFSMYAFVAFIVFCFCMSFFICFHCLFVHCVWHVALEWCVFVGRFYEFMYF